MSDIRKLMADCFHGNHPGKFWFQRLVTSSITTQGQIIWKVHFQEFVLGCGTVFLRVLNYNTTTTNNNNNNNNNGKIH